MIFLMNSNSKIIIDPDKSILELKQVIACSLNHANTIFNLINNAHIIDVSKNYCSIWDCGINRTIRIVIDYISAQDNIEIVVVNQNDERVKLSIEQYKSILELKKGIASKFNIAYTGFNILYEGKLFDDSKNSYIIREYEIEGEIVIIDNINLGPYYINLFVIKRVAKPFIIKIYQNGCC